MSLENSACALKVCWITPFWTFNVIRGDDSFSHKPLIDFVKSLGSTFGPIPPRRNQKNVLESKHAIIQSIYLRLQEVDPCQYCYTCCPIFRYFEPNVWIRHHVCF